MSAFLDDYADEEQLELSSQLDRFMQKIGMQDYTQNLELHHIYLPELDRDGAQIEDLIRVGVPLSAATVILQQIGKYMQKEKMRPSSDAAADLPPLPPADDAAQYKDGDDAHGPDDPEMDADLLPLSLESMRAALIAERNKNQDLRARLAFETQARKRAEIQLQQKQEGVPELNPALMLSAKRSDGIDAPGTNESGKEQSQADSARHSRASSISEGVFNSSVYYDEQEPEHDADGSSVADSAQAECRSEVSFSSHVANASDAASDLDSMHAYSFKDSLRKSAHPPLPLTVGGTLPAVVGEEYVT